MAVILWTSDPVHQLPHRAMHNYTQQGMLANLHNRFMVHLHSKFEFRIIIAWHVFMPIWININFDSIQRRFATDAATATCFPLLDLKRTTMRTTTVKPRTRYHIQPCPFNQTAALHQFIFIFVDEFHYYYCHYCDAAVCIHLKHHFLLYSSISIIYIFLSLSVFFYSFLFHKMRLPPHI